MVEWKYGWQDKNRANTLGSPTTNDPIPMASGVPSTGYSPFQISQAYGFNLSTNKGANQVIAIVTAYGSPSLQSDFNLFCSQYGLPPQTLSFFYPAGVPSAPSSAWALETTMDVEWAHALAPAARVVVVVSPDASIKNLLTCTRYAASTLKATVVSMSWGAPEFAGEASYDVYFNYPSTKFVAASGDNGAGVNWPSVSTNVLAVGGTSLLLGTGNTVKSETGWKGSGGGKSLYEPAPAYQNGLTAGTRSVPDTSFVADPYTGVSVYYNRGWYVVGGTSLGTPCWSALLAVRASGGNSETNTFQTSLYQAVSSSTNTYSTLLRDIVQGTNGIYSAVTGYDLVSGLGSPRANNIVLLAAASSTNTTSTSTMLATSSTKTSPLTKTTLPKALQVMSDLNKGFDLDEMRRCPGGGAFFTDGTNILDTRTAVSMVAQGTPVYLTFFARVKDSSSLTQNYYTGSYLGCLNYVPANYSVEDNYGSFPAYNINL